MTHAIQIMGLFYLFTIIYFRCIEADKYYEIQSAIKCMNYFLPQP